MKYLKYLAILAITGFFFSQSNAQYKSDGLWGFTYDVSVPMGDSKDYIGKTSWRGFTMQGRGFVSPQFSIGGSISWNVFFEKTFDTYEFSFESEDHETGKEGSIGGALSGTQFRYLNSVPIMVTAHYYTGDPGIETFSFFAGLGVGTSLQAYRVEVGNLAVSENTWHFAFAPEVGIVYGMGQEAKLMVAAKYHNSLKSSSAPATTFLSFQVGIATGF